MATTPFTISECLAFGWRTFKSRPWFFAGTIVVYAIAQIIIAGIQESLGFPGFLLSIIISTLFYIGFVTLYLKAHDAPATVNLNSLWNPKPFWNYLGVSILVGLIVIVGLILLIVPGIILGIMFSLAGYLTIEKGLNPIAAMKESARLTRGHRVKLFLLGLSIVGLTILAMIPLFLGLFIMAPIAMLAGIHAYRALLNAPTVSPAAS